jgi:hypothetical protein
VGTLAATYFPVLVKMARTGEEKVCRDPYELPKGGFTIIKTRYTGKVADHEA